MDNAKRKRTTRLLAAPARRRRDRDPQFRRFEAAAIAHIKQITAGYTNLHVKRAREEATTLYEKIRDLHSGPAESYIDEMKNKPSNATIAQLAFIAQDILDRAFAERSVSGRHAETNRYKEQVLQKWGTGEFKKKTKCADWAVKQFPVKHRVVLRWLSQERKGK